MAEDEDPWLQETVIEFLRMRLENDGALGEVVDGLISDFLEEIGVTPQQFAETISKSISTNQLSSFVLSSILTVEDFLQFKAMMVRRNVELTHQVLAMIENRQIEQIMRQHQEWQEELNKLDGMTDEEMLEEALRMSKEQFNHPGYGETELAAALKASTIDDSDAEFSEEFKQAMALSLREKAAIDLEKAELEQALALSLALEQEHQAMQSEPPPGSSAPPARSAPQTPAAAPPHARASVPPMSQAPKTAEPAAEPPEAKCQAAPAPNLPAVKPPPQPGIPYIPSQGTSASQAPASPGASAS
eukprot:scaffold124549_cov43-Prasinocladus_malaysianus.AAC.3